MTRLLHAHIDIKPANQGGIVTIGNFDGVHVGHQRLLKQLVAEAKALGVPSTVVTFEPHPAEFFSGEKLTIPRITRLREKFAALAASGVDQVWVLRFNAALAHLTADAFIQAIIVAYLRPIKIIIGDDFRFGHQRQGDVATLTAAGKRFGFAVQAMPTLEIAGARVSSTRLRDALKRADQALVNALLGHAYTMQGRVRGGDALGRRLGFPTANLFLHRRLTPIHGIYTVYMHGLGDKPLPGVANIGTRPTVNGTQTLLEVHLLDFSADIYGRYVTVEFCEKLRDEAYYPTLTELQMQISQDVEQARHYFINKKELS